MVKKLIKEEERDKEAAKSSLKRRAMLENLVSQVPSTISLLNLLNLGQAGD